MVFLGTELFFGDGVAHGGRAMPLSFVVAAAAAAAACFAAVIGEIEAAVIIVVVLMRVMTAGKGNWLVVAGRRGGRQDQEIQRY